MLRVAITESGWSMREIARRCTKNGVNLSQPYLSKLCTGEIPPASDKVNKILGNILSVVSSISEDDLLIAAYLEKIPDDILAKIKESTA